MTDWVRFYHDTPTDPKWRVIAKRASARIGDVIAVWSFVLVNASANANERGRTHNLVHEDIAAALDLETDYVTAIMTAMEGKTIINGKLTGWEKRNPIKDDGAAERAKRWRERKRTRANAANAIESESDTEKETEIKKKKVPQPQSGRAASPKPAPVQIPDWIPAEPWAAFVAMRKAKGKPMSEYSIKLMMGRLSKLLRAGEDLTVVLNQSILNCWQDVYAAKPEGKSHVQRQSNSFGAAIGRIRERSLEGGFSFEACAEDQEPDPPGNEAGRGGGNPQLRLAAKASGMP